MKVTLAQKKALLSASLDTDYCIKAHHKVAESLIKKGLARYTSGFGYRFGGIIELTSLGKELLDKF